MFDTLSEKFADAFKVIQGKNKISESNIEDAIKQVRTALLEADVNFKVVKSFVSAVKDKSIPIDFSPNRQAILANIQARKQSEEVLQNEGVIIIFPSGALSEADYKSRFLVIFISILIYYLTNKNLVYPTVFSAIILSLLNIYLQ